MDSTPHPEPTTHAQFMAAAAGNDVATLRRYLEQGGNVDLVDAAGETALLVATRAGHEDCVLALLDASPRIDADWKGSALDIAIQSGHEHLAAHLYRAARARREPVSDAAMHLAITKDDLRTVRSYLAQRDGRGALIEPLEPHLLTACIRGRHAISSLLLSCGADPHFFDDYGPATTPMAAAAANGDTRMIDLLLQHPTASVPLLLEPNHPNPRRVATPLKAAASHHRVAAVAQLLKAGDASGAMLSEAVVATLQNPDNVADPAMAAATFKLLLDSMSQAGIAAAHAAAGHSLLHLAGYVDATWGIDVLVARGMPVDFAGSATAYGGVGMTAFLMACYNGGIASIGRLAAHGANLEQRNNDGNGALTLALRAFNPDPVMSDELRDLIGCLLDLGCDPDAPDGDGQSPRMRAARLPELVQMMDARTAHTAILGAAGRANATRPRAQR